MDEDDFGSGGGQGSSAYWQKKEREAQGQVMDA
jgi:hypothetical protein